MSDNTTASAKYLGANVFVSAPVSKGETSVRRVFPNSLYFGRNPYHVEPQWLLHAFDLDKNDWRTFAVRDIQGWEPTPQPDPPSAVDG